MACITYDFSLDEQGWDLDSGSTGAGGGVYSETYDSTYEALKMTVELAAGNAGTFNGNVSTIKAPNLNTLTWEKIGVPSGSYVTDVYIEFEYSVLITEEAQVVKIAPAIVAYNNLSEDETLITAQTLSVGSDFSWGVKSTPKTINSSFVTLPTPDLASNGVGIVLGYSIGQQASINQVDTIWYSNVKVCANYITYASTDSWDGRTTSSFDLDGYIQLLANKWYGRTSSLFDLDGIVKLLAVDWSGRTDAEYLITSLSDLISDNWSGKTDSNFLISSLSEMLSDNWNGATNSDFFLTALADVFSEVWSGNTDSDMSANSRGVLQLILNGGTSVSKLNLIGLYKIYSDNWNGATVVNKAILSAIADMISDDWDGSTSSSISYTAIGDMTLSLNGSTNAVMNIEDATGGIRQMVTDNWSGTTSSSITPWYSIEIYTDGWSGHTDADVTASRLVEVYSDNWYGETTSSIIATAKAFLSTDNWSGRTDFEISAESDTDGSSDNWNGSTVANITATSLANTSTDNWSGTTNFVGVIEDGDEGVKDIYIEWSGRTGSNKLLPEPSTLQLTTDNWSGRTDRITMRACCFNYWQVGEVKVHPEEICEAYIGMEKVW